MCTLRGHKVAYPAPFEAILRAKRALLANLQACGTLQGTGIIRAVDAHASRLNGHLSCHPQQDILC